MVTLEKLIENLKKYNPDEVERVTRAYYFAEKLHRGQKRQSGEDYIVHPLSVAYILTELHADGDTICAGLLHDTLEDTNVTREEIIKNFNYNVANLVEGVTKISGLNFSSTDKHELYLANTRKIIMGITEDVRIIIIKLADRLHNMRTLEFKSKFKQQENALETMDIYVPFAYYIGAYWIKNELEDLSFKYLKPDKYLECENIKSEQEKLYTECLEEMLFKIQKILNDNEVSADLKYRIKNIYGIYKNNCKLYDIHDLFALKVVVDNEFNCYNALRLIHKCYYPVNSYFKDFICNPKTNMYQALHTTVFGPKDRLVQVQIRDREMDKVATNGLTHYWDINKGLARDVMQAKLKEQFPFFKSLVEMNHSLYDNQEFVLQVKSEIFADNVYVKTTKGQTKELPKGSTVVDYAYYIHTDLGNKMVAALVNDEPVSLDYVLQSNDRVRIITNMNSNGPKEEWLGFIHTARARKKIREFLKDKN